MNHPFDTPNESGDFTPTLTRADRAFHNLDHDVPVAPRKRPAHRRATPNTAARDFHRLDVCDLIG